MKYIPRQPQSNVNVTPTSPLKDFFVLAGGLLGIVVVIYLLLGLAVDVVQSVSPLPNQGFVPVGLLGLTVSSLMLASRRKRSQ